MANRHVSTQQLAAQRSRGGDLQLAGMPTPDFSAWNVASYSVLVSVGSSTRSSWQAPMR